MPYEIVITNMWDMQEDIVPFGEDKATARLVFDKTWNGLLRDGFVSVHNASNETMIQYWKKGEDMSQSFFIELREAKPKFDFANLFAAIHMTAKLGQSYAGARGAMYSALLQQESYAKRIKTDKYIMTEKQPGGLELTRPMGNERIMAISAFIKFLNDEEHGGAKVWRGVDADLKYYKSDARGTSVYELVEVR